MIIQNVPKWRPLRIDYGLSESLVFRAFFAAGPGSKLVMRW